MDLHGRILGRYYFFQVAPHLYSRGWVDLVPDPLLHRKSGSTENRTRDLWTCNQKLWPLDHRGGQVIFMFNFLPNSLCSWNNIKQSLRCRHSLALHPCTFRLLLQRPCETSGVYKCWWPVTQVLDVTTMQQRMKDLNCVDVSPTGTSTSSPEHQPSSGLPSTTPTPTPTPSPASGTLGPAFGDDSSSYCSDGSQGRGSSTAPPRHRGRSKLNRAKKLFHHGRSKAEDHGTLSDSECQPTSWREQYLKDANSNHTKVCVSSLLCIQMFRFLYPTTKYTV
jgi:hypothetical protein